MEIGIGMHLEGREVEDIAPAEVFRGRSERWVEFRYQNQVDVRGSSLEVIRMG